jgi:hypothetical protein
MKESSKKFLIANSLHYMLLYKPDKMPVLDFQPDCLFLECHLIRSSLLELRLPFQLSKDLFLEMPLPTSEIIREVKKRIKQQRVNVSPNSPS